MFDFPSSGLTVGQVVNGPNGTTYKWDWVKWVGVGSVNAGVSSFNNRTGAVTFLASDLPAPTATSPGGVRAAGPVASQWINSIPTTGIPTLSQPAFSDISGLIASAQIPASVALTGTPTAPNPAPGTNNTQIATTAWVTSAVAGGGSFLPISGRTLTGNLAISPSVSPTAGSLAINGTASGAWLYLNKAAIAGTNNGINGQAGGVSRWSLYLGNSDSEAGSNTGSTFAVNSYDDTGALLGTPLQIARRNGGVYVNGYGATLFTETWQPGHSVIRMNKAAGAFISSINGFRNGIERWDIVMGNATAETGSNVGSDFQILNFSDTGGGLGAALTITRSNGNAVFSGSVSGGSYYSSGGNAGIYYNSRSGSGDQFCIYNLEGTTLHFWQSSTGDIVTFNKSSCNFNQGLIVATAPQIKMTPSVGASGYGAMWHNDGSNFYLLLTNQNDAQGGWNGLRPFMVNVSNGAMSIGNGLTVSNNLTANNITTQYGIVYSGLAGNVISFRWTGNLQIFVDNNYNGDIAIQSWVNANFATQSWVNSNFATSGSLGNYVNKAGDTMSGRLTTPYITVTNIGIIYSNFANNNIAFKWVGNALQIMIDGNYNGTINISSDARMKSNRKKPEVDALEDIRKIKLESFDQTWPNDFTVHYPIGVTAQNLQEIGADMVDVGAAYHDDEGNPSEETRMSVALLPLLSRLVGAVQQLSARVVELEARVA